ncbi:MAG: ABC transporter permease [Planctomycetia bacterium]|nr:ABC transporter permease [Planctomycetia bacterium]
MYKFLLCWRYLRTRYIALASIISVTLGVATMIVVNSVMAGFSREMQTRIHGILSDVVLESQSMTGFFDPDRHMAMVRDIAGDDIEGMTPTVHVPAMLAFNYTGQRIVRPITLIGIEPATYGNVGDYSQYLQHPENQKNFSFSLRDGGYRTRDPNAKDAPERPQMEDAGWKMRRRRAELDRRWREEDARQAAELAAATAKLESPDGIVASPTEESVADPFKSAGATVEPEAAEFDPAKSTWPGIVLGIGLVNYQRGDGEEHFLCLPGDDVTITVPSASSMDTEIKGTYDFFTVVDLYESKMSEYDSSFCFVPLKNLQELLQMVDKPTGIGYASAIQIKLKPGVNPDVVRDKLRAAFPEFYSVQTWRDKQGPLLAAVQMETAILNVLLFLIIAVAGFGILAIFYMIVVEKTRDIGILKSLGAPGRGIMGIFLTYGLSLGTVGSGAGMVLGLLFALNINEIAGLLAWVTGQEVFDPSIYYFYEIPVDISPFTVSWIVLGAVAIAVMASVLPARRAARLHPVEALRYE